MAAAKEWTARWIESIKVDVQRDFIDPATPGLSLRVMPTGTKSWSLLYRRQGDQKRRRVKLGEFPKMGLKDARFAAGGKKEKIAAGEDPAGKVEELKKVETADQLLDRFLTDYTTPGPRWAGEMARMFKKDVRPAIGRYKITAVSRTHILAIVNAVKDRGAGSSANRTLAAIRRAFNWAVSEGYLSTSPAVSIPQRVKEVPRDRALTESEIRTFWTRLDNAGMTTGTRLALQIALTTGQRIGEVCGAKKSEINLDNAQWVIPAERAKNGREHSVPLSPLALALFNQAMELSGDSMVIFPARPRSSLVPRRHPHIDPHSIADSMRRSLPELGLEGNPATPHDLRRTVASQMAAMGTAENIVARVLNHSSEIGKTITGKVYIKHAFAAEKRHALETWAAELNRIVEGEKAAPNVIAIESVKPISGRAT